MNIELLKYPTGKFDKPTLSTKDILKKKMDFDISTFLRDHQVKS
jgi:hypothetical protein